MMDCGVEYAGKPELGTQAFVTNRKAPWLILNSAPPRKGPRRTDLEAGLDLTEDLADKDP